jgi:hypothetical protein
MNSISQSSELAADTVWPIDRVKDHASKIGSGITPSGGATSYVEVGVPLLRSQNVHFDGLRLDDVAYITEETHEEMSGTQLRPRDVLLYYRSFDRSLHIRPGQFWGRKRQPACVQHRDNTKQNQQLRRC